MTKPLIMGILNVTPDSFYDGGKYLDVEEASKRIEEMIAEGADIIDIGGESTGPGSSEISTDEEMSRIIPVIKMYNEQCTMNNCGVSIDTYKSEVARKALEMGVSMINDVTAGRGDPKMFAVIADTGCKYIIMHSKDNSPRTTIQDTQYDDVLKTIHEFFEERIVAAETAGIQREQLILDPGLGHFVSSDPKYSWQILENLEFLRDFGCPILVSPSRKSFTGKTLEGTLKATKIAVKHGAGIVRTHDIKDSFLARL